MDLKVCSNPSRAGAALSKTAEYTTRMNKIRLKTNCSTPRFVASSSSRRPSRAFRDSSGMGSPCLSRAIRNRMAADWIVLAAWMENETRSGRHTARKGALCTCIHRLCKNWILLIALSALPEAISRSSRVGPSTLTLLRQLSSRL